MNKIANVIKGREFETKSSITRLEASNSEKIGILGQHTGNIIYGKNSKSSLTKSKESNHDLKGGDNDMKLPDRGVTINKNFSSHVNNRNQVEIYRCDLVYVSSRKKVPFTPVENCELQPVIILRDRTGKLWDDDDESPDNPVANGSANIYYRWSRGPPRAVCTYHPSQVSVLQCATTLRCFCGPKCFRRGFSQLKRVCEAKGMNATSVHENNHAYGVPCRKFEPDDPDTSLRERDSSHISLLLKSGLVSASTDEEDWVPIANKRNYLPASEDVGHQLKLEVFLLFRSASDSSSEDFMRLFSDAKKYPGRYSKVTTSCCVPNLPPSPPRRILAVPNNPLHGIRTSRNASTSSSNIKFKVFSWNILAEIYATQEAFPHCDAYMLSWSYRKIRIAVEILIHQPDIVCLQEVQTEHFDDFFKPILKQYGYDGIYKKKTTEIFTSGSGRKKDGKYTMDGCAIFYKSNKFIAKENFSLEFSTLIKEATHKTLPDEVKNNPAAIKRLLKDNIAVVTLLEYHPSEALSSNSNKRSEGGFSGINNRETTGIRGTTHLGANSMQSQSEVLISSLNNRTKPDYLKDLTNSSPIQLVIANTHIVANPEANDVKIWQAQTLVSILEEYLHNCYKRKAIIPGLVVCGDFNSTPDSALYRILTTGSCERTHRDLAMDSYGLLSDLKLGHSMRLRSAYSMARAIAEGHNPGMLTPSTEYLEPVFTNFTPSYIGCLDYVFYTDERLKLKGTLELLDEKALIREADYLKLSDWCLPNPQRPSDHLPLLTEFEWVI